MKKIRWGIFGTGLMADLFTQALLSVREATVELVVSGDLTRAQQFASRFGIQTAIAGYEAELQTAPVDVFYVATPNESHAEHCERLLGFGKAVLCEKPFATNKAEGEKVLATARSRGLFCMEAMWMRFAPAMREALREARNGKLGEIHLLSAQLGFPYNEDPGSRLFRQPGGGALLDLGVYPVSFAHAVLGKPCRIKSAVEMTPAGVDGQFAALLEYPNGAQAMIAASLRAQLLNSGAVHGTKGILKIGQPLYFPESYEVLETPLHQLGKSHSRPRLMTKVRRLPGVRAIAELRHQSRRRRIDLRSSRSGYTFEAIEVQRCLTAGLQESPEMTWDDSLAVLQSMDRIRQEWAS